MRLIDADELIEEMRGYGRGVADANIDQWTMIISEAMVNKAKTVDAEPVVRCKDCKCWEEENKAGKGFSPVGRVYCTRYGFKSEDWFCADGEMKDNATD